MDNSKLSPVGRALAGGLQNQLNHFLKNVAILRGQPASLTPQPTRRTTWK